MLALFAQAAEQVDIRIHPWRRWLWRDQGPWWGPAGAGPDDGFFLLGFLLLLLVGVALIIAALRK